MDFITLIVIYTVGTLFGMLIGSRWGVKRGIALGVTTCIAEFEELDILDADWRATVQANVGRGLSPAGMEKLKKDLEKLDEDEQ